MFRAGEYMIRYAESADDFERIHRLNYETFVREIPQHRDTGAGMLVDKHHDRNRYLLAFKQGELVGMLSACEEPPFSVATRLPDPAVLDAPGLRLLEIRLLSVVPAERGSPVLAGLVWQLYHHAKSRGATHFVISGVESQADLYRHLGFEPLGPPVGDGPRFTPMWLPVDRLEAVMGPAMRLWERRLARASRDTAGAAPSTEGTGE